MRDSNDPIIFRTLPGRNTVNGVSIRFDLQPTYGNKKQVLGRATQVLTHLLDQLSVAGGPKFHGLSGVRCSSPIIGPQLEVIGTVHFEITVVTPFSHPNLSINSKGTYWKSVTTKVSKITRTGLDNVA